jgi:hypothetical protein
MTNEDVSILDRIFGTSSGLNRNTTAGRDDELFEWRDAPSHSADLGSTQDAPALLLLFRFVARNGDRLHIAQHFGWNAKLLLRFLPGNQ